MFWTVRRISPLILALALAGCATPPRYIARPVVLPLPERPTLPHVSGAQMQCLSDAAYSTLVERERAIKGYAEQLRAIIRANNEASHAADDGR
jgi:hypothetical protein